MPEQTPQPNTKTIGTEADKNPESPFSQIRTLLGDGQIEAARLSAKKYWLINQEDPEIIDLFAEIMKEAGRQNVSVVLQNLSTKIKDNSQNGKSKISKDISTELFAAGYALIDSRQPELASMLLKKCVQMFPDDPTINYELGFALMSLKKFNESTIYFQTALKKSDDFDTNLNLAACYTLTRKLSQAKSHIDRINQLAQTEEEKREVAHRKLVMRRFEGLGSRATLTARDWLYVLYGSVLLRSIPRLDNMPEDYRSAASMLVILKGVLDGLRIEFEAAEYYNVQSRPFAKMFSELSEISCDSYRGPARPEHALLIIPSAKDLIGPHESFIQNSLKRSLFSYNLPTQEPLPIVPDIVGCLGDDMQMPWEDTERGEHATYMIMQRARQLESDPDIIRSIQDTVDYYIDKRELLVINNTELCPQRPEFTAEIQC
jgi:tetratricopeptide (TPR) repeat protein